MDEANPHARRIGLSELSCARYIPLDRLNVTSSETTTTTQFDLLFIEVRSTSGTLLATLATFSNLNKGTAGVYLPRGPFSVSAFAGQTIRVQFRATEDRSLPTSFRVDDVSVQ
jgi:hypothetical protein